MTVGASQALDIAIRAIVNPGEEVIIPEPCFVAYDALVSLAGGIPVHVHTTADKGFKATVADFEAAVTEKRKPFSSARHRIRQVRFIRRKS